MKETVVFIASLIIIGVAVIVTLSLLYAFVLIIIEKHKKKELRTLRLAMKEGDKTAELKLKEQLLFFEKRVEDTQRKARTAEKELQNFKTIYELFNPDNEGKERVIRVPEDLTQLSFEGKDCDVFLMRDELKEFLLIQEDLEKKREEL